MTNLSPNLSQIVAFIGVMAFAVSTITEAMKKWSWFDQKVPSALVVIVLSVILCPITMLGLAAHYGIVIDWFTLLSSFVAAFIVSLVAMDGWERVTDLAAKLIKRK